MATTNDGKSAGSLQSPASDGGTPASSGGAPALPERLLNHAAGIVSASAASQIHLESAPGSDAGAPIIVAQAATPPQGVAVIPSGTATGKLAGTIAVVVGDVKVIGVDGVARIAQVGDKVFFKETIVTGADGMVHIKLEDGRLIDLGFNGKLALDADVIGPETAAAGAPAGAPAAQDVAALQAAIAAGADPTQIAQATAAGGAPGAGGVGGAEGGGSHQPVVLDQANTAGDVTSGFNTQGASIAFPTPEFELLAAEEPPAVFVSVQVTVDVEVPPGQEPIPVDGTLGVGAANVPEGTAPTTKTVNFVITLDHAFSTDVQVTYAFVDGSAINGVDYIGVGATITIPAGQTNFIVSAQIVQDHLDEGPDDVANGEAFSIVLTDAVNATINPAASSAVITIIDDDAPPVANPDTNWTQEDLLAEEQSAPIATGNVLVDQSHPGDPSAALSFADAADTDFEPLTVSTVNGAAGNVGAAIAGTYGTLTLNADGTYTYVLNNAHASVQGLDDGETLTDAFTYTVNDGFNADSAPTTLTITIFGTNDAPVVEGSSARVSEEGLAAGIPDDSGNDDETNDAVAIGTIFVSDADNEALTVTLEEPSQALTSNGVTITWSGSGTNTLVGSAGESPIITITINDSGEYTVTLSGQIDHVEDPGEGELSFTVGVNVFDGTATTPTTLVVTVEDDAPIATQQGVSDAVEEDDLNNANSVGNNEDGSVGANVASGSVAAMFASGADQPLSYGLDGDTSGLPALTSKGDSVTYSVEGNTLIASAGEGEGARTVFTLSLESDGDYTFTLLDQLDHADDGENDENTLTIDFGSLIVATDADDDSVDANSSFVITVQDDIPVHASEAEPVAGFVEEDGMSLATSDLSEGNKESGETNADDETSSTVAGSLASLIADGADESVTFSLKLDEGDLPVLWSKGEAVTYEVDGNVLTASASDGEESRVVFTLTVNSDGSWSFDLVDQLDHVDDGENDENTALVAGADKEGSVDSIDFSSVILATDADGDELELLNAGDFTITVEDDIPVVSIQEGGGVAHDETSGIQNDEQTSDVDVQTNLPDIDTHDFEEELGLPFGLAKSDAGQANFSVGSDEDASVTLTDADGDLFDGFETNLSTTAGDPIFLVADSKTPTLVWGLTVDSLDGATIDDVAFAIYFDPSTGVLYLAQWQAIDHGEDGNDPDSVILLDDVVHVTVTDADGDSVTSEGTFSIAFDDDGPVVDVNPSQTPTLATLNLDETQGTDRYASADVADNNGAADDVVSPPPFGRLVTAEGALANLFTVAEADAGRDGQASRTDVYSLTLTGNDGGVITDTTTKVATTLSVTDVANAYTDDTIYLIRVSDTEIDGVVGPSNTVVLKFLVDNTADTLTVEQYAAIRHTDTTDNFDEQVTLDFADVDAKLSLTLTTTVVDGDGDSKSDSASVEITSSIAFDDDGPALVTDSAVLANQIGNKVVSDIDIYAGADGLKSLKITGFMNGSSQALAANGSVLKSGSEALTYVEKNGILYAVKASQAGDLVNLETNAIFSVAPNATNGTYTVTVTGVLDAITQTFNSNFGTTDAGGPDDPYRSNFTTVTGATQRVDIFGFGATQAKPSSDGLGIDNNLVNGTEKVGFYFGGATIDKVFVTVGNFAGDSFAWSAIKLTTAAATAISGLPDEDPSTTTAWTLQEFYDSITFNGTTLSGNLDGTSSQIIGNLVLSGQELAPGTLGQDDNITFTLDPTGAFDFLYLTSETTLTNNNSFKIVQVSFEGASTSSPVAVNFTATATDGDDDAASNQFVVTFAGNTDGTYTLVGTNANEALSGATGNDSIDGGSGIDLLDFSDASGGINFTLVQGTSYTSTGPQPGSGNDMYKNIEGVIGSGFVDTITGSSGNDILVGGMGADTLNIGSGGSDTLLYHSTAEGGDAVSGFQIGATSGGGDVIDIHDILATTSVSGSTDATVLANYVNINQVDGTHVQVQVDPSGTGTFSSTLVTLTLTATEAVTLQSLLQQNQLVT